MRVFNDNGLLPSPWLIDLGTDAPAQDSARLVAQLSALTFGDSRTGWPDEAPSASFALLDAARLEGLPEILAVSDLEHTPLFRGHAQQELRDVAPWLVRLAPDHQLTRQLLTPTQPGGPHWHRWGLGAVTLIRSTAELPQLLRHFRKYTRIFDDHGARWNYFRFYAPETLRGLIANMEPDAFASFAAPVQMFITEGRHGQPVLLGPKPRQMQRFVTEALATC